MALDVSSLPALEKLIKEAEYENSKLISQIDEEKQIIADLNAQINSQNDSVANMEKSISSMHEETEALNSQFKQNKDVAESFRKSTYPVDSHIELLENSLHDFTKKNEEQSEKQRKTLENYTIKWQTYQEKWENQPMVQEIQNVRKKAFDADKKMLELTTRIQELQLQIEQAKKNTENGEEDRKKIIDMIVLMAKTRLNSLGIRRSIEEDKGFLKSSNNEEVSLQNRINKVLQEKQAKMLQVGEEKLNGRNTLAGNLSEHLPEKSESEDGKESSVKFEGFGNRLSPPTKLNSPVLDQRPNSGSMNSETARPIEKPMASRFMQIQLPTMPKYSRSGSSKNSRPIPNSGGSSIQSFSFQAPKMNFPLFKEEMSAVPKTSENLFNTSPNVGQIHEAANLQPSIPRSQKEEKGSPLNDSFLMKAPTKGSPGSRRNAPYVKTGTQNKSPTGKQSSPVSNKEIPDLTGSSFGTISVQLSAIEYPLKETENVRGSSPRTSPSFCITESSCFQNASNGVQQQETLHSVQEEEKKETVILNNQTEANDSAFQINLNFHEQNVKEFTKSPSAGFLMSSRPMFQQNDENMNQHFDEKEKKADFGNFLASDSFINSNSFFSFGNSSHEEQTFNISSQSNDANGNIEPGDNQWLNICGGKQDFQEPCTGFSLFNNNASEPENQATGSPAFNFGFAATSSQNNEGTFSLF